MEQAVSMAPRASDPQFLGPLPVPEVQTQLLALWQVAEPARAESLLRDALELDPYCMDTYFAFCRLFVRQGRWREAENAAVAAMSVAARNAGMNPDWRAQHGDMYFWKFPGPAQRYYLAALEAMAAVCLHQCLADDYADIMAKLAELGLVPQRKRRPLAHHAV